MPNTLNPGDRREPTEAGPLASLLRLANRLKPAALRGRPRQTAVRLRAVAVELRQLSSATEGEFLCVLKGLSTILEGARTISGGCALLLEAFQSAEAVRLENELRETLVQDADQGGAKELAGLMDAAAAMRGLQARADDLHGAVRIFGVLGTATRIERERLGNGGSDFEGMSDQVTQLAADLDENSGRISETCIEAQRTAADALATASQMERRRDAELPRILENASTSLAAISRRRQDAAALSGELREEFDGVSRDIGELVNSLQYQDITRQRLEHVAEALEETLEPLEAGAPRAGARAASVARMQLAHLRGATDEFVAAVTRIGGTLDDMSTRIRDMAARANGLLQTSDGGQRYLRELSDSLQTLARSLSGYRASTGSLVGAAETVTSAIGPIAGFATRIEEIGLRIERVSLNTNVKAARLGADGAALSAIAGAIQNTAAESRGRTGAVIEAIQVMTECAERLSRSARTAGAHESPTDLVSLATEFERHATAGTGRIEGIGRAAADLAANIAKLRNNIVIAVEFQAVADRCIEGLEQIAGETHEHAVLAAGELEQSRSRYTMEAERAVHDSVLNQKAPPQAPASELGDNVELF